MLAENRERQRGTHLLLLETLPNDLDHSREQAPVLSRTTLHRERLAAARRTVRKQETVLAVLEKIADEREGRRAEERRLGLAELFRGRRGGRSRGRRRGGCGGEDGGELVERAERCWVWRRDLRVRCRRGEDVVGNAGRVRRGVQVEVGRAEEGVREERRSRGRGVQPVVLRKESKSVRLAERTGGVTHDGWDHQHLGVIEHLNVALHRNTSRRRADPQVCLAKQAT